MNFFVFWIIRLVSFDIMFWNIDILFYNKNGPFLIIIFVMNFSSTQN